VVTSRTTRPDTWTADPSRNAAETQIRHTGVARRPVGWPRHRQGTAGPLAQKEPLSAPSWKFVGDRDAAWRTMTLPLRGGPTQRRRHPPRTRSPHGRCSIAAAAAGSLQRRRCGGSGSTWPPRSDRSSHTPIHAAATASGTPHRNDGDPKADHPADDQQDGGVTREDPRSQASQPEQHPTQRKDAERHAPAGQQPPVGVAATSAGALSTAHGTAKASNHQAPASSIVPSTATRRPTSPSVPLAAACRAYRPTRPSSSR
jgi:hypothetical protein